MAAAPLGTGSGEAGLPTSLESTSSVHPSDSSTATTNTILTSENHLQVQQTHGIDLVDVVGADGTGNLALDESISFAFRLLFYYFLDLLPGVNLTSCRRY